MKNIWIEFYPTHGQKSNPHKLRRFSESYWRQRIFLNIQINNWNPVLKESSLAEGGAGECAFVLFQISTRDPGEISHRATYTPNVSFHSDER